MDNDQALLLRCLELAEQGKGGVSPNPMVGSVITKHGNIIGEGFHKKVGFPHAEVEAINSVTNPTDLQGATLFVNLEPCNHFGKTPPCTENILKAGITKVVFGNYDPNPKVRGEGAKRLQEAGVEVVGSVLEKQSTILNKRFITYCTKKRPYVIVKWASSGDGFISSEKKERDFISNPTAQILLHQWRSLEDAILVGAKTAIKDNPKLNNRLWKTNNSKPILRLVIAPNTPLNNLNSKLYLFDQSKKTIIYSSKNQKLNDWVEYKKINTQNTVQDILKDLYQRQIQSVIIEGGYKTLQHWIDTRIWDEARILTNPNKFLGSGLPQPQIFGAKLVKQLNLGQDIYNKYINTNYPNSENQSLAKVLG